ncbi:Phytochelatin synthase [Paraburkholderia ribeironis]|uniref:glutathione gamma-glutamylcysteinyltransferase n=1 Tax=Paraburkholderia ribeironis TaxID=1247936 RepID=A0A1N7SIX8_9BURK|nr:phytochelatin synthase family protein [Paraburkholderia ribeironis]SIT47347.1 Phytochelatin synthase [Paraburkholderia ribeironis]
MSTDSSIRAVGRRSAAGWLAAIMASAAALSACAPLPPATSQHGAQAQTVAGFSGQSVAPATAASLPRPASGPLPVPAGLVPLMQPEGQQRLMSTAYNQSYWPLSQYFETQRNEAWCSVATSVMALNALGIRRPESSEYPDFPFFSQQDFFRGIDAQVANAAQVSKEGMTLDQLSAALRAFPVEVTKFHASDLTLEQFRDLIRDTTSRRGRFALLNFRRMEIGETGGGHWSPLAAYDAASDSALLLDVARYKYPAVWVPLARLYAGAQAVDSVSHLSRGLLIIGVRAN